MGAYSGGIQYLQLQVTLQVDLRLSTHASQHACISAHKCCGPCMHTTVLHPGCRACETLQAGLKPSSTCIAWLMACCLSPTVHSFLERGVPAKPRQGPTSIVVLCLRPPGSMARRQSDAACIVRCGTLVPKTRCLHAVHPFCRAAPDGTAFASSSNLVQNLV